MSTFANGRVFVQTHGAPMSALVLRVGAGGFLVMNHGWPKLMTWGANYASFADPLGVSHPVSLALTIFGELVCGLLIVVGLVTRWAALPAIITMLVAAFIVHHGKTFSDGEHALLYAIAFTAIALLGPGPWSVDGVIRKKPA